MIQDTHQRDDEGAGCNNGEQYITPDDESQALDDEADRVHNQGNDLLFILL